MIGTRVDIFKSLDTNMINKNIKDLELYGWEVKKIEFLKVGTICVISQYKGNYSDIVRTRGYIENDRKEELLEDFCRKNLNCYNCSMNHNHVYRACQNIQKNHKNYWFPCQTRTDEELETMCYNIEKDRMMQEDE